MSNTELAVVPANGQVGEAEMFVARAKYKFADLGGAISTINLLAAALIPIGALIISASIKVVTPPTSGGAATIALQVEGAGDLIAATAFNAAPFSTGGQKALTKTFATAHILTTAARNIAAVIAGAALTGGEFEVLVFFLPSGF